mmetsp:Transcript_2324/g.3663  ORF Transcript_2324/g.3663 Transcript_2324/m.3663 type:complete len:1405 (+) Transcript_2324:94-4308(+)
MESKQNFLNLRRRLSDLNYTEKCGVDSSELVEHLLNDLVSTTTSYKQVQDKEARLATDLALAQAQLFPLRKENARLNRENHELHIDSIRQNDEINNATEDYSRNSQKLQEEIQDLMYLCEAQQEQLRTKGEALDKLRDAYDAVTDPSLRGNTNSGATRAMKVSSKLSNNKGGAQLSHVDQLRQDLAGAGSRGPSTSAGTAGAGTGGISRAAEKELRETIASLKEAAREAEVVNKTLRNQLESANKAWQNSQDEVHRLTSAIAAREQEIARSSKFIAHTGDPASGAMGGGFGGQGTGSSLLAAGSGKAEQLMAADVANKRIIDQLNGQVDFLNEQLAQREAQLIENNDKMLQFDSLRAELVHRNSLLDQSRGQHSQATSRIRALEQKIMEYHEAQAAWEASRAAAARSRAEGENDDGSGNGDAESKGIADGEGRGGGGNPNEVKELKLVVGKVTAERDHLQEEVERLQKITSTLTAANAPPPPRTASSRSLLSRTSSSAGSGSMKGAAMTAAARAAAAAANAEKEKEKQQAAMNVLVMDLNAEIEEAKKKIHALTRSLLQKDEQLAAADIEKSDALKALTDATARQDRSQLQQMHADLQEQLNETKHLLEDCSRDREQLRAISDAVSAELATVKQQLHNAEIAKEEAEVRLQVGTREISLHQESASKLRDDLSKAATSDAKLRIELEGLEAEVARQRQRADSVQRLVAEAQLSADTRAQELAEATRSLALLKAGASGSGAAEEQLREEKQALESRIQTLEATEKRWQQERWVLQRLAKSLGVQYQQERAIRGQLEEQEVSLLLEAVVRKEEDAKHLMLTCQEAQEQVQRLEGNQQRGEVLMKAQQAEMDALQEQHQEQSAVVAQLESELALLQQRYTDVRSQQEETLRQQDDMQHMSASASNQLSSARRELQNQRDMAVRAQQAVATLEEEKDGLRRQLEELTRRSKADRQDLSRAIAEKADVEARMEDLKALVANLEASLRAQSQKQQRLSKAVEQGEEDQQYLDAERQQLLEATQERDRQLRDQKEALQQLDRERDRLQEQLDTAEEQMEEQQQLHKHQELQIQGFRQAHEQGERKVVQLTGELTAAQRHAAAAEARLSAAQLEINELKRRVAQKNVEVGGAAEDLMLMTRENQALTSELVERTAERDRVQSRLQEVLHASASTEHARRAVEVEKTDLLHTYRAVLQEKRKLEGDIQSLSTAKQREGASSSHLQGQMAELQGALSAQSAAENRWRSEKSALLAQLDTLNDQLVRAQNTIESIEADNRRLMNDTHGLKQSNVMLNERVNMIIKRAGAATDANKLLTSRLGSVERERDAVRALVGLERQRASEMGHIAETARAQAATKELQIQRLRTAHADDAATPSVTLAGLSPSEVTGTPTPAPAPTGNADEPRKPPLEGGQI